MTFARTTPKLLALIALALLAVGAIACTGDHRSAAERRADKIHERITARLDDGLDELEATAEQRTKVHAIKDELFDEAMELRKGSKEVRKAALEELKRDEPDAKKLHDLVDERAEEMRALAHQAVDGAIELHGVLTPEQRAEIAKRIEERMAEHDE
ncbi:MAG: periplasmic heavy metal sensor [Deltaproteobacteria bacterium]|nr:periplasmic heavy metal sensor [Deltaproteobacteria bacterium]